MQRFAITNFNANIILCVYEYTRGPVYKYVHKWDLAGPPHGVP